MIEIESDKEITADYIRTLVKDVNKYKAIHEASFEAALEQIRINIIYHIRTYPNINYVNSVVPIIYLEQLKKHFTSVGFNVLTYGEGQIEIAW